MIEIRKEGEGKDMMLADALKQVSDLKGTLEQLHDQMKEKEKELATSKSVEERIEEVCGALRGRCHDLMTSESELKEKYLKK